MSKQFGMSLHLDCYKCRPGACDDLELHYRFLETLVEKIGMTPMAPPYVIHAPRKCGVELFPEKAGVTGFQPLIESGITIHSCEPTRFMTLDLYSCNQFDPEVVKNFAFELFGFERYKSAVLKRGENFPEG